MKDIFHFVQKQYDLRNDSTLQRRRNCTLYFGKESISSLANQNIGIVPCKIKNTKSLDIFKEKIKLWTQINVFADFTKCGLRLTVF